MDPLTHALTGVALGHTGLKRWCRYGATVLVLGAVIPDIEIVTSLGGAVTYLHYHRHLTHALVAAPLVALLPWLVVLALARGKLNRGRAYVLALLGVFSHLAFDLTNAYGVRLLLPFSDRWLRLDINSLTDFWILGALMVGAFGPWLAQLVSSEIGDRRGSGRGLALLALVLVVCFDLGRYVLHERAVAVLDSRLYQGVAPTRVAAFPGAANPLRWTGLVETPGFYSIHSVNLREDFDPTAGHIFYQPELGPAETVAWEAARRSEAFRVFLQFAQYPLRRFYRLEEPEAGLRVEAMDLRFGNPGRPRFVAVAIVDFDGRVRRSSFGFLPPEK